jgi:hypothetical protein
MAEPDHFLVFGIFLGRGVIHDLKVGYAASGLEAERSFVSVGVSYHFIV